MKFIRRDNCGNVSQGRQFATTFMKEGLQDILSRALKEVTKCPTQLFSSGGLFTRPRPSRAHGALVILALPLSSLSPSPLIAIVITVFMLEQNQSVILFFCILFPYLPHPHSIFQSSLFNCLANEVRCKNDCCMLFFVFCVCFSMWNMSSLCLSSLHCFFRCEKAEIDHGPHCIRARELPREAS